MIYGRTLPCFYSFFHTVFHTKNLKQVNDKLYYNKITEKEGIDKTNRQDCHGKTNLKLQECYYCLNYFFVFKNFKYYFNLRNDCYHCKQREKVWKSAYFWMFKVKSGIFRSVSNYQSSKIINLLEKSQLDEKYSVLNKKTGIIWRK